MSLASYCIRREFSPGPLSLQREPQADLHVWAVLPRSCHTRPIHRLAQLPQEFPVPVPQAGGGISNNITIEWKDFGVLLNFVPFVMDDETIRLHVAPEVSSIDFSIGTTLVVGGDRVPGVNTRRSETTVELKQGQTLAIAGLLQVDLDADTSRIPGLGDLPYIGPLFSSTSHERTEKELLVLVTPFLVSPMCEDQVPALPGSEIKDPNDLEFYFLNRIEGRTGRDYRLTTNYADQFHLRRLLHLEQKYVRGPVGFSDCAPPR